MFNAQELEVLKTRLQHEFKEVSDVFKGELDEVNGKLATSDRMLSHMQRYMGKIDAELQVQILRRYVLALYFLQTKPSPRVHSQLDPHVYWNLAGCIGEAGGGDVRTG